MLNVFDRAADRIQASLTINYRAVVSLLEKSTEMVSAVRAEDVDRKEV
ncbi:hypothetical protein [Actinomadura sp. 9N407]